MIYETDGENYRELSIQEAMPYFECSPNIPKLPFYKKYYDLLDINKTAFINAINQEMIEDAKSAPQSGLAHKKVVERIKFVLQECRRNKVAFTDNEEKFLNDVLELYEAGTILNQISIKIKKELEETLDCREAYEIIKANISEEYFRNKRKTKDIENNKRGIILSTMLSRN